MKILIRARRHHARVRRTQYEVSFIPSFITVPWRLVKWMGRMIWAFVKEHWVHFFFTGVLLLLVLVGLVEDDPGKLLRDLFKDFIRPPGLIGIGLFLLLQVLRFFERRKRGTKYEDEEFE